MFINIIDIGDTSVCCLRYFIMLFQVMNINIESIKHNLMVTVKSDMYQSKFCIDLLTVLMSERKLTSRLFGNIDSFLFYHLCRKL